MKTGSTDWNPEKADAPLRITFEVDGRTARVFRAISHLTAVLSQLCPSSQKLSSSE